MSSLPDRKRPRLTQPARSLTSSLVRLAGHGAWRVLHPATRGPFLDGPRPEPLPRLYYEASDGWRAPVTRLDVAPGAPGEPVLVAHGLGMSADGLRYGRGQTLAGALQRAGFAVYLWSHRADGEAIPPSRRARSQVDFDAILERDLPAAVACVLGHAAHPRLHFVGHGLGGQLGLCWAAGRPEELGALVALAAPLHFATTSALRRASRALAWLPSRWRVPLRSAARIGLPFMDDGGLGTVAGDQHSVGRRVRGGLAYTADDVPVRLLRQVLGWYEHGTLTSYDRALDWSEAVRMAEADLLVICGAGDELCPAEAARSTVERWAGRARFVEVPELGHLDLLHGAGSDALVFQPIVDWLVERRKNTWLDVSTDVAYAG